MRVPHRAGFVRGDFTFAPRNFLPVQPLPGKLFALMAYSVHLAVPAPPENGHPNPKENT